MASGYNGTVATSALGPHALTYTRYTARYDMHVYIDIQIHVYHVLHIENSSFTCKCCTEMKMSQMMFLLHVASVALLLELASGCAVADESSECPNWYHRPPGSHHCQCGTTLQGRTIVLLDHITVSAAQPCRVVSNVLMMECISIFTSQ